MRARTVRLPALLPLALALAGCEVLLPEPDRLEFRDDRLDFTWGPVNDVPPEEAPVFVVRGGDGRIEVDGRFPDGACVDLRATEARDGRRLVLRVTARATAEYCVAVLVVYGYETVHRDVEPGEWTVRIEHDHPRDGRDAEVVAVETVTVD